MALKYGPFNGLENAWDAYDFAEFFKLFFGNGVFPNPSNNLQVIANGNMQTKVSVGVGFVEGHKIKNTSDFILQHDIADGVLKRIDCVVMRANFLQNKGEIIIKKGTPASSPVAPNLVRNTDYYELALADVLINNGATVITQANITDQRLNTALCGVVATNITQLDTETLALQYQSAFEQMTVEQQQEFEEWVDSLKDILDENIAVTLATRLTTVEGDVDGIDTRLTQHLAQKGQPNGYASLDANGKVPNTQLNISIVDASTTQKGIVQLNNATNSTSTTQAATANAVKLAYDRAEQAFTQANDIKTKWASVVGSPLVSTDTQAQLQTKTQTIKNTLATNIANKGVTASGTETLTSLTNKVASINQGPVKASGTFTVDSTSLAQYYDGGGFQTLHLGRVSGLGFTPIYIKIYSYNANDLIRTTTIYDPNFATELGVAVSTYTGRNYPISTYNFAPNYNQFYIRANEFSVPVVNTGTTYYWYAEG